MNEELAQPIPGIVWGDYPERDDRKPRGAPARAPGSRWRAYRLSDWMQRVAAVRAGAAALVPLDEAGFTAEVAQVRADLSLQGLTVSAVDRACACVVDAARRALGRSAYDGQVIAALCMMDNRLVEMATGEGKSLATALAAALAALAGMPVHVLTANDYLVARDAESFQPLFRLLGLAAVPVLTGQTATERRAAYAQPIVYATAREIAFDYMRDRLQHGVGGPALAQRMRAMSQAGGRAPLLRGLCMAIIDEADSVLIDDALMPLVLSQSVRDPAAHAFLWQAWTLSNRLQAEQHFILLADRKCALLTDAGRLELARLAATLPAVWKNTLHREETVQSALSMRHCLHRDEDYLVTEPGEGAPARIDLIDTVTGRIAEGRKWSAGLHALAALKEGLQPEDALQTLASITFQRFFRRYHRLGGMSGTLTEVRGELRSVYGLHIVAVPARLPLRRATLPTRCFVTDAARWQAVVARAVALARDGRPVLIGTDSVAQSWQLSAQLSQAGVEHAVLNARHDAEEAAIVAQAGQPGRITVSTNMAGRGTDIALAPSALAAGGLHVLCCQHNASRRHDRQLSGRAGRQGEPGSCELWVSLESPRLSGGRHRHPLAVLLGALARGAEARCAAPVLDRLLGAMQTVEERRQASRRQQPLKHEADLEQRMSFCGPA